MATISLYNRPELLRSGNQTLRPAQFQLADSGLASGLGQIAKISANIASDLNQKAQKAEDSTTLINLDRDLTETNLTLSKWQMENSNNGQIMKDGSSLWETKTRETYDNLMSRYNDINMTPETRQRVNTIINHHAGNAITSSWAGGIKQIGNNFDTEFTTVLGNVEKTGDGTIARQSALTAREGNVINDAQFQAREQAISNSENRFKLNSANAQVKTLIETAAFDPNNYDKAKGVLKTVFESNLITKDEYNAQISNIDYKFQYNDKLSKFYVDLEKDPVYVNNRLSKPAKIGEVSAISISTEKVPEPLKPHISSFEKYGKQYGVDPNLLLSISLFETGNGTSSAFRNKNNAMGISDDSGPTVQPSVEASVEKMARLIGQSPTYKNAKTIEDLANIYSPPGASNDPNQTNSQWPSSVRAKYKEITGTELPKEYNFRNLNAGEYSWMSPVDFEKAKIASGAAVAKKASDSFNTLKNSIDLNQVLPDAFAVGTNAVPLSKALENPNYSALNSSDNEDIKLMKKALLAYGDNKAGKMMTNDSMLYEDMIGRISSYDPTKDPTGSRYASIGTMISSGFTDKYQSELQSRLDKQKETGTEYQFNKVGSDAINALNKRAFDEQVFGEFRKVNLVEVQDQDRKIYPEDIKANTLFMLPDPNNPSATIRRVPTQADIDAGLRTGTKRFVIPVKPNSVSYLQYTGEDSAPELIELKKDEWEKVGVTPVYDEDLNQKSVITERVKSIRGIIEKEVREGTIKNNEDAIKRMNALSAGFVKIPSASNTNKPIAPISKTVGTTETIVNPQQKKNAVLEILKRK